MKSRKWIFLLASKGVPEDRHVDDVRFGIEALIDCKISVDDISVVLDTEVQRHIQIIRGIKGFTNKTIYKSSELKKIFMENRHSEIVLFVNGHGHYLGLASTPIITPFELLNSLQNANNLERGIVFLGQCVAGIFNHMPVMARKQNGKNLPPLVVIGSTGLNPSISSTRVVKEGYPYQANIFFYYLFQWMKEPVDIDGDGNYSLSDAYKYISYSIIEFCNYQKINNKAQRKACEKMINKKIKLKNKAISETEKKLIDNQIKSLTRQLLLYDHTQQSWMLNAIEASNIYF